MFQILSKKTILIGSFIFMLIMFSLVVFIVNPLIDGKNGMEVVLLQLSFQKVTGLEIVNSWGETGILNFNKWIFTDYLYALSYSIFLGSLLSWLIIKKGKEKHFSYTWVVYFVFSAGLLDCIENSIEIFFINNPSGCSSLFFFLHSIIASIKWCAVPIVAAYIGVLLLQKNKTTKTKR